MSNRYMTETDARAQLKRLGVKPGSTVYTILRHVSASGMSRVIDLVVIHKGEPCRISHAAAALISYNLDPKHDGLKVGGAGMDMGFHVVYSLSSRLWPKGTPKAHSMRNGEPDRDGGYALKQRWL